MYSFTTPNGKRIVGGTGIAKSEDREAREAREYKTILRALRECNQREISTADNRLRAWRYHYQCTHDVE